MAASTKGDGFKFTSAIVRRFLSLGGTGSANGGAGEMRMITKLVTAFADTVAKDVFTVTVPNTKHSAVVIVDVVGSIGAGGAVGAGESSRNSQYQVVLARTAGLATVAVVSAAVGGAVANVAGGTTVASVVVTVSAMTGANSATQTFTIKVAITKTGGAGDNHTAVATARLLNQFTSGVTIS